MSEPHSSNINFEPVEYLPERRDVGSAQSVFSGGGNFSHNGIAQKGSNQPSDREQLDHLLDLLMRRKWVIIACFILFLAGTMVYSLTLEPEYEAASFVLLDLGKVVVDLRDVNAAADAGSKEPGFDLFARSDRSLEGEIRLLQLSEQLVQRVRRRLEESSQLNTVRGNVIFIPERGGDNIIRFVGKSSSASQSALLANLYAEEYVKLTEEASRSHIKAVRESLEENERVQREELDYFDDQIKRFKQEGAIELDQQASRIVGLIASSEVQLEDANIDLEIEQAGLESLKKELETVSPKLVQRIASGVEQRISYLQELLATEEDTRLDYLLANPDVTGENDASLKEIDTRIALFKTQIDSLSEQYVSEVTSAVGISGGGDALAYMLQLKKQIAEKNVYISRMKAKTVVLTRRIQDYQRAMVTIPEQSIELAHIERSKVRVELVYQKTVTQLQDARVAEESAQGYAQVIRSAVPPNKASGPDLTRNILLGSFLGLLLGFALAFVTGKLDSRIYQPEQLRQLGYKEIGVIPSLSQVLRKDFGNEEYVQIDGRYFATSLVALHMPLSFVSETYRLLRTGIQLRHAQAEVQTLVVTSPGPSEGKSTTASNLAIAMAQNGRNVLLIDADMRRPKLHNLFCVQRELGLGEVLTANKPFTLNEWRTSIKNLYVLTSGRFSEKDEDAFSKNQKRTPVRKESTISTPSELLESERMHRFIDSMREYFDTIIIDTPPVLVATEASVLSASSDATLIVVRAGVTQTASLKQAMETLSSVGASVVGVLLNGFEVNMAYGNRYKYQEYAQYNHY